jgi:hypothetical protein
MIRNAEYILIILLFIVACSKKDDPDIPNKPKILQYTDTVLTGRVIDQVSKLPVAGAAVYLGALPYTFSQPNELYKIGPETVTDENGKYKLTVAKKLISHETLRFFGADVCIYASKTGFAGSGYCDYLNSQIADIELYHPAKLKLRVWNDTISNNIDDFEFAICGMQWTNYPGYFGGWKRFGDLNIPKYTYTCSGRRYDRIFEWASLWGNMKYKIYKVPNYFNEKSSVILKPDSTTSLSISF